MAKQNNEIDLVLSVLCIIAEQGESLTSYELAELCGCHQTYISNITRQALAKLKYSKLKYYQ